MRKLVFPAVVLLLPLAGLAAGTKTPGGVDTQAAYARLRSLAGEWEASTPMGKAHITYELIANGSALVEREWFDQNLAPMETIYHPDGDRLLLTHYCMLGNQPRMQAESYNSETGELKFKFLDGTNLASPNAGHMHNATFRFVDDKHLVAEWELFENGKLKNTEHFDYYRVR